MEMLFLFIPTVCRLAFFEYIVNVPISSNAFPVYYSVYHLHIRYTLLFLTQPFVDCYIFCGSCDCVLE